MKQLIVIVIHMLCCMALFFVLFFLILFNKALSFVKWTLRFIKIQQGLWIADSQISMQHCFYVLTNSDSECEGRKCVALFVQNSQALQNLNFVFSDRLGHFKKIISLENQSKNQNSFLIKATVLRDFIKVHFEHLIYLIRKAKHFNKIQQPMSTRKISNIQRQEHQQAHIKVFIRLRPLRNDFSRKCVKIIDRGVALNFKDKIHQLYFDGSFDEAATQQELFKSTCEPIVNDVLKGNNCSLFVYGQTGTGKTYTMGTLQTIKREDQGLISLSLNYIINHLQQSTKKQSDWSVSLSFMQIYMQDIFDLLNPTDKKLQIREDIQYGQTYVEDLVIVPISNYKQSIDLINAGLKYRKTGNQRMNQLSSRSHTILTIYVSQKISNTEYMSSTLNLIDLAGSQRIKKSNSVDQRLDQAKFINSSLSSLGNVISSLAQNNTQKFVPYRSSKLTRILKNSLTGHSKVSVICTLDTSQDNQNQTYSTLLFADRCKQIRFPNQPIISIETFEQLEQEKNLKTALQKAKQKQKQYLDIIKNYEQGGSRYARQSARELQLSQIIEGIYKLFGQINSHLKKVLDPQQQTTKQKQAKPEYPKVISSTTTASIKGNITNMAQQTIGHINTLSSLAFGQSKVSIPSNNATKLQVQTLTSLLLDNMRQNSKLYQSILIKDQKDSLQKEIALEEYEKQKKQDLLNKLRTKKLKNLLNTFEQIWSEGKSSYNPLQNLLETIRKGDMSMNSDRTPIKSQQQAQNLKEFTNPKQFLKMLTKKQAERKHKQMLIDEGEESDQDRQISHQREDQSQASSSGINYFKNSPGRANNKLDSSKIAEQKESNNGNSEIKKLLDSLIASKSQYEPKRKMYSTNGPAGS